MFTSIPIEETINIIKNHLNINNDIETTNNTANSIETTLKQNYFTYDNNFYLQKDGLPMGSPLSSIVSEIFLQNLENKYIESLKQKLNIVFYGRYVDDILIIYNNVKNQNKKNLKCFNNLHNKINFTLESEQKNTINYLDLKVIRNKTNIEFDIYRKPTSSKASINYYSNHPSSYKFSNFHFMLNRINNIPLSKPNYKKRINYHPRNCEI
ncbi:hypothetical protein C0J52_01233 [Blattella germanica]|nr:hypothetical protein C0J52_01233 [Blattella germanica]